MFTAKESLYFDIRVQGAPRNTLHAVGSYRDGEPIPMRGHVVFSLKSTIKVHAISLNFKGLFKVHFKESFQTNDGKTLGMCPFETDECIIDVHWDNLITSSKGAIIRGAVYNKLIENGQLPKHDIEDVTKASNNEVHTLAFSHLIPMGSTPFPGNSEQDHRNIHYELPPGNYCLPFEINLPSILPETVEGPGTASITYRLQGVIDMVNDHSIVTNKYIRIIRTPPLLELTHDQEYLAENSWKGKMEYKIRLPKKNIAIGSDLKINILIIPLLKDLKLARIAVQVIQTLKLKTKSCNGFGERKFTKDNDVYFKSLPYIDPNQLPRDGWALVANIPMPSYLKQCSQDIETFNNCLSIKHRLVLYLNFVNGDGHISQVKSRLPLQFHISSDEYVAGKNIDFNYEGDVCFAEGYQLLFDNDALEPSSKRSEIIINPYDDNMDPDTFLFADQEDTRVDDGLDRYMPSLVSTTPDDRPSTTLHERCNIPPRYQDSQYDLLFQPESASVMPSPRALTPISITRNSSNISLRDIQTTVPKYREVFDDGQVSEPSPLYAPMAQQNLLAVTTNRLLNPLSRTGSPLRLSTTPNRPFSTIKDSPPLT